VVTVSPSDLSSTVKTFDSQYIRFISMKSYALYVRPDEAGQLKSNQINPKTKMHNQRQIVDLSAGHRM